LFSAFNRFSSACSSDVAPGRDPALMSACTSQRRTLSRPMPQLAGHGFSQRGIRRVILTMIGDHPQRLFLHRGINLSWHVLILLNSERCGIKPVTIQSALVSSAASRMSSCRWKIRAARPSWGGPVGRRSLGSTWVAARHTCTSAIKGAAFDEVQRIVHWGEG